MKAELLSILIKEDLASEDENDAIRFTIKRTLAWPASSLLTSGLWTLQTL